ncbi:hypothetical protein GLW08_20450 [Pontibacillus yanchengensis]|uniref:SbsA Ig-like domain-containing protein n=2 Tax=Pontibacillus yanchengensis TaxID=462910 RepID=A0A6I5A559_9BACI|nr:Ig-like domain-containing protein [Pontibacillus yanchengensis]MYL35476.1 hypothetical protein [Pontibacillus yanchengensis]MYL55676.1 hypothetical protein [Pontibacillus yanchengensis]
MKKAFYTLSMMITILIAVTFMGSEHSEAEELTDIVDENKEWTITFNTFLDPATVNNNTVYVTKNGEIVGDTEVEYKENAATSQVILRNNNSYAEGEYTLHVSNDIKGVNGVSLKERVSMVFKVKEDNKSDYKNMSLSQLKEEKGEYEIVTRRDFHGEHGIVRQSLMGEWYKEFIESGRVDEAPEPTFEYLTGDFIEDYWFTRNYQGNYPKYEVISFEGKAYKDSVLYKPETFNNFELDWGVNQTQIKEWLPTHPEKEDGFFIDVALYSTEFPTYKQKDIHISSLASAAYKVDGTLMMDINGLFENTLVDTQLVDGNLKITHKGKSIQLSTGTTAVNGVEQQLSVEPQLKDIEVGKETKQVLYAPIEDVVCLLGLDSRHSKTFGHYQIANYDLEEIDTTVNEGKKQHILGWD